MAHSRGTKLREARWQEQKDTGKAFAAIKEQRETFIPAAIERREIDRACVSVRGDGGDLLTWYAPRSKCESKVMVSSSRDRYTHDVTRTGPIAFWDSNS